MDGGAGGWGGKKRGRGGENSRGGDVHNLLFLVDVSCACNPISS